MTIIILTLTALHIYERVIYDKMDMEHPILLKLDFKPFNCLFCLSFWSGLVITLITLDPIYLGMPLFYKLTQKI